MKMEVDGNCITEGEELEEFDYGILDDVEMLDDELKEELDELEKEENQKNSSHKEIEKNGDNVVKDQSGGNADSKNEHKDEINSEEVIHPKKNDLQEQRKDILSEKSDKNIKENDDTLNSNSEESSDHSSYPRFDKYKSYGMDSVNWKRLNKPLHVTKDMDKGIVAREIAYRLEEKKYNLIRNILNIIGVNYSMEVFKETKKILKKGGLKTDNGLRKRTPGGTFLYLLRNRGYITNDEWKEIYKDENDKKKKQKRSREKLKRTMEGFEKKMKEIHEARKPEEEKKS